MSGRYREGHRFSRAVNSSKKVGLQPLRSKMGSNIINALFVFMLAAFIGFEVIRHVSPLLHTPLMSLTNALDAIAVVGAIVLVGEHKSTFATVLGFIAIVAATSNVVGGFFITDRMLRMFKTSRSTKPQLTK
jgi:NAD(P) transhydrogenase subunit alpha